MGGYKGQIVANGGESGDGKTERPDRPQVVTLSGKNNRRRAVAAAGDQYPLPDSNRCCRTENPDTSPENTEKIAGFPNGGAIWGALEKADVALDPMLAVIVAGWNQLPEAIKVGIVAMVKSMSDK